MLAPARAVPHDGRTHPPPPLRPSAPPPLRPSAPPSLSPPPRSPVMPYLPTAAPAEIGFDPQRLDVAYRLLKKWTDDGTVPSGAITVGRQGRMVEPRLFGRMGPGADAPPIRPDAMFLLASITKPIVYFCAMQLVEQGRLSLTDPVVR